MRSSNTAWYFQLGVLRSSLCVLVLRPPIVKISLTGSQGFTFQLRSSVLFCSRTPHSNVCLWATQFSAARELPVRGRCPTVTSRSQLCGHHTLTLLTSCLSRS